METPILEGERDKLSNPGDVVAGVTAARYMDLEKEESWKWM